MHASAAKPHPSFPALKFCEIHIVHAVRAVCRGLAHVRAHMLDFSPAELQRLEKVFTGPWTRINHIFF